MTKEEFVATMVSRGFHEEWAEYAYERAFDLSGTLVVSLEPCKRNNL